MDDLHSGMAALAKAEHRELVSEYLASQIHEHVKHIYLFTAADGAKSAGYSLEREDECLPNLTFCVLRLSNGSIVTGKYLATNDESAADARRLAFYDALNCARSILDGSNA